MADENITGAGAEAAPADATVVAPKKQRAPRRAKAAPVAKAASAPAEAASDAKPRGRRAAKAGRPAAVAKDKPAAAKTKAVAAAAKPGRKSAKPAASAKDEVNDLVQLEQENKRLRQALAEKLRAENADLRKRIGL